MLHRKHEHQEARGSQVGKLTPTLRDMFGKPALGTAVSPVTSWFQLCTCNSSFLGLMCRRQACQGLLLARVTEAAASTCGLLLSAGHCAECWRDPASVSWHSVRLACPVLEVGTTDRSLPLTCGQGQLAEGESDP